MDALSRALAQLDQHESEAARLRASARDLLDRVAVDHALEGVVIAAPAPDRAPALEGVVIAVPAPDRAPAPADELCEDDDRQTQIFIGAPPKR